MPDFNLPQTDSGELAIQAGNLPAKVEPEQSTLVSRDWTRAQVMSDRTLYLILPQALMPPFALTGLLFHQLAISESKGWSPTLMASGLLFFAVGRTLNSFITGPLVDRWQAWRLFPFYQVPLALGFFLMGLGQGRWVPGLAFLLFGLAVGSGGPIKSAIWAELYGVRHLGAIKSFFATLMIFSTATSPALFGWCIQAQGHPLGLLTALAGFSLMAAVLAWWGLGNFFKQTSQAF
jgi:MFS family permease